MGSLFALGAYFACAIARAQLPLPPDCPDGLGGRAARLALCGGRCAWRRSWLRPFGLVLERLMRRTYGRDPLYGLLLTFGVAMVHRGDNPRGLGHARLHAAGAARACPAASSCSI